MILEGNTFIKLNLVPSSARPSEATTTHRLDEAISAVAIGCYDKALVLIAEVGHSHSHEKRQIQIEALEGLGRHEELIDLLKPPQNADEVVKLISLLLDAGSVDQATTQLEEATSLVGPQHFRLLK